METEIVICPYCGSSNLATGQKGFSTGKAIGGVLLTNVAGLLAGFIGSSKAQITCLKCGRKMKISELKHINPNLADKDGFPPVF
jgi:DNA-directed RNA polymerase subunit RPC12/RpoP